jgi:hypothetical protein
MSVLDYGCGHGADVRYLKSKKIRARGWDPHYAPEERGLQPADVVNLGYVLNVIEKPEERVQALRSAFALAQKALVVAVRVDRSLAGTDAEEYGDGVLTARDTFQKVFTQGEFQAYLENALGHRPQVVSLGVAYVFRVLDTVVLTRDLSEHDLQAGDLGTVVELYAPDGLEVEFVQASGKTKALVTLKRSDVRAVADRDTPRAS